MSLQATAVHESSHAVMALACGVHFDEVRVYNADEGALRGCKRLADASARYLAARYLVACAGPIGETLHLAGFSRGDNPVDLWNRCARLADASTWSGDVRFIRLIRERIPEFPERTAFTYAVRGVADHWGAVQAVASALTWRKKLSRSEVQRIAVRKEQQQ